MDTIREQIQECENLKNKLCNIMDKIDNEPDKEYMDYCIKKLQKTTDELHKIQNKVTKIKRVEGCSKQK